MEASRKLRFQEDVNPAVLQEKSAMPLQQHGREGLMYLHFSCKDKSGNTVEIVLTPKVIKDIRQQLQPQIKQMPVGEVIETIEAAGLSPKNILDFFTKKVKFDVTLKSEDEK